MNKPIQIKRNKPASSHYRVLYAKTGRKRKLHAATTATADQHAGMGADVPSIGVGRALFVILILHVLAVAAIYIHSAFFADSNELIQEYDDVTYRIGSGVNIGILQMLKSPWNAP